MLLQNFDNDIYFGFYSNKINLSSDMASMDR